MAVTDIVPVKEIFGGVSLGGFAVSVVTFLILSFLSICIIIGVTIYLVNRLKYKYRIVVFEKINGIWQDTRKDKAMEFKLGKSGDNAFYIRRHKKIVPIPTIQTGIRKFWYAIREDGEWINIGIEDIDLAMRKVKARFLDKEMRHSRTAMQQLLKERYDKPSFWSVYGGLIAYTVLILITGIMMWLLFDKFLDIGNSVTGAVNTAQQVLEKADQILGKLDNLQSGGGFVPAR